jgi:PAS domain S-box-containing protein
MRRESEIESDRTRDTIDYSSASSGQFSYNSFGNFLSADEIFASLVGYSQQELLSMNFIELVHAEDIEKILKIYEMFLKTGYSPQTMVIKCIKKDRAPVILEITGEVMREADEIKGFRASAREVKSPTAVSTISFAADQFASTINGNDNGSKRTFSTLRNMILIALSKGQLSINEISHLSGINWKTVENHLVYLIGRRLAHEHFTSRYVRLFELTKHGEEYVVELKRNLSKYMITPDSEPEVKL